MEPGDKEEARRNLGLPLESKIVFIFGQKWRHLGEEEMQVLRELDKVYDLQLLIISETQRVAGIDLATCTCIFKKEVLERDKLFQYLHASDTWLFPKHSMDNYAVLSSTIHSAIGSGCVTTARDSNFLYGMRDAVLHYSNREEFKECLVEAFEQGKKWRKAREEAKKCSEDHEDEKIAGSFIKLFESIV